MRVEDLLEDLLTHGGVILAADSVSDAELKDAQMCGRWAVDDEGTQYIRRTNDWRMSADRLLTQFAEVAQV